MLYISNDAHIKPALACDKEYPIFMLKLAVNMTPTFHHHKLIQVLTL